ncbi:hypothetical protein [Pseudofrankia sp. BMG5.36]|uniref:hypothetical protein n=1 Tax=Pseudofrankia sp. BMG5.36 TaxID=1834512 RepID=UPI0018E36EC5|nr:hypothetical protein [Pseudofrankia sp. BMG5.36]
MDNAAVSTVPVDNAGTAAGIFNTMRITGESVAVSAAAAVLTTLTAARLRGTGIPSHTATHLAGQAIHGQVTGAHHAAVAGGFADALHTLGLVLAALSTAGATLTYLALAPRGEHHTRE